MDVRIGTSGWSYRHWRGPFYPEGLPQRKWLEYYGERFDTVEINNSFYRLPTKSTFEAWRTRTPDDFRFAVKASRFITHMRRLVDCAEPLKRFFEAAGFLEGKLAVVLFQLPMSFKKDVERVDSFLKEARRHGGRRVRLALEVRSETWLSGDFYRVLERRRAALVFADWGEMSPAGPVTADFVYLRRHGPKPDYGRPYSCEEIARDASAASLWLAEGLDVYAYYNNDVHGHAVENARRLRERIGG